MIQLSKKEQTEMMSLKGQSHYITNVVQVHKSLATAICIEKKPQLTQDQTGGVSGERVWCNLGQKCIRDN